MQIITNRIQSEHLTNMATLLPANSQSGQQEVAPATMGITSWANLNTILQQENRYKDADPELSNGARSALYRRNGKGISLINKRCQAVLVKILFLVGAVSLQRLGMTPHEFLLARERALQHHYYPTKCG